MRFLGIGSSHAKHNVPVVFADHWAGEEQFVLDEKADESPSEGPSSGTVTVRNNGPTTAPISYYVGVNGGGQQQATALGQTISVAPPGTSGFSVSSLQSAGVVTSYGNVWWSS